MKPWILGALWLSTLIPSAPVEAQRPISIGVAGGVSVPQGPLRNGANTGWHALGALGLSSSYQPLGLRLDVAYNRFGSRDQTYYRNGYETATSATMNVTYRLPMTASPMSPYLISGLGAYRTACYLGAAVGGFDTDGGPSGCDGTHYGWNAGLGAKLFVLRVTSFVEARYHRTKSGGRHVNYFPISVGLML
ncbi:MAG: hypothetical protein ACR2OG_05975 [Gemmatimonadaceae bacterium]